MAVAVGALIGTISVGGGAYIFGATLASSMLAGAALGSLFSQKEVDLSATTAQSPTYTFGSISNTKTQKLPIPILYGGPLRVGGNIIYELWLNDKKSRFHRFIGISEGPIESITEIQGNDQGFAALVGCSVSVYLNTTADTSDSRDPAGTRPYPNDIAMIATTAKAQDALQGSVTFTSIVKGRQVWTPSGTTFSTNPAWIVRDFLTNTRYGCGIPESRLDSDSFEDAADYCSELVDGEPRFELTYYIDTQKPAIDFLADMLSACRGYLICREQIELHIDQPGTPYKDIGESQIIEGSFSWWQAADEDIYNRVVVEWTDPDNHYEQTVTVFEDTSDITNRGIVEKSFPLIGIAKAAIAARMGAYLIDMSQGCRNFCSFNLSLRDADVEAGDIIRLTHPLPGWENKWMRVSVATDNDSVTDTITVVCAEYVSEAYNDTAMDVPEHIDTGLASPFAVPDVTSFNVNVVAGATHFSWLAAESTFLGVSGYEIRRGATWASAVRVLTIAGRDTTSADITGVRTGTQTYWIAAIGLGQYSENPLSCSITVTNVSQWDVVQTYDDYMDDVVVTGDSFVYQTLLVQNGGPTIAELEAMTVSEIEDEIMVSPPVDTEFVVTGAVIDLGAVTTAAANIEVTWYNAPSTAETIEMRQSIDNVDWGEWAYFVAGTVDARYIQVRVRAPVSDISVAMSGISIIVDVPEQTLRFHGVAVDATDGASIEFAPAFVGAPAVVVTPQSDSLVPLVEDITNEVATVKLKTLAGASSAGTVEVIAHGF